MNTMGCSTLFLAAVALMVGFIPILGWITVGIALPLAVVSMAIAGNAARKPMAQSADKALFWIAAGLAATIIFRMVVL